MYIWIMYELYRLYACYLCETFVFCFSHQQGPMEIDGRHKDWKIAQVKELILWRAVALGVSATQARLKNQDVEF